MLHRWRVVRLAIARRYGPVDGGDRGCPGPAQVSGFRGRILSHATYRAAALGHLRVDRTRTEESSRLGHRSRRPRGGTGPPVPHRDRSIRFHLRLSALLCCSGGVVRRHGRSLKVRSPSSRPIGMRSALRGGGPRPTPPGRPIWASQMSAQEAPRRLRGDPASTEVPVGPSSSGCGRRLGVEREGGPNAS